MLSAIAISLINLNQLLCSYIAIYVGSLVLKVTGYALNIEYYFWWRDQCFWLINPLRCMALPHGQYQ